MDEHLELRCRSCGAPFEKKDVESNSPYVTCEYCGTSQQRVDARKYMEQMMGQVRSWLARTVPDVNANAVVTIDPVARRTIFAKSIKPKIEVEVSEYRLALNSALSSPLVVLPFTKGSPIRGSHTPAEAFEFQAKLESIEDMAVDEEDRTYVKNAEMMALTYALLLNNSKLLDESTPGRFSMMAGNFREAADDMAACKGYEEMVPRLQTLSEVCEASEMILNGNSAGCAERARRAAQSMREAKQIVLSNPRLAMTLGAVDSETEQCDALANAAEMFITGATSDPLKLLETMGRINSIQYPGNPQWNTLLARKDRPWLLFDSIRDIVQAKNGGSLPICNGRGNTLMPFWDADLQYSFETGSVFSRKSVIVKERLMIPAVFTVFPTALSDPRTGLTDIFAAAPESKIMDRMKGQEDSISGGAGIGRLADSTVGTSPGSKEVFVPLSTKADAEKLTGLYLTQCSKTHSRLKLSKPVVNRLIYVPCDLNGGKIVLPDEFKGLEPRILSDLDANRLIRL